MTTATRRSRRDVRLGRFLRIGQTYRERDTGDLWTVRQVHRADCEIEITPSWTTGQRVLLTFDELRRGFVWIAGTPRQETTR